ncbi:MAG: hypothetical protein ICV64_11850 [Thermoleophilia bacterium]|nr:hypothetical protein [Thermoleophilia bacterium]
MHELSEVDELLRARFAVLATDDHGDWDDVRRRARRRPSRRRLALALAALAAIAVTAPAFGLHRQALDWFRQEAAPPRTQLEFLQLGVGAPPGMDPQVVPNSARRVLVARLDGRERTLWVAPTRRGGFCVSWSGLGGGCIADRGPPLASPPERRREVNPLALDVTVGRDRSWAVTFLAGSVLDDRVERLVVEHADGERVEVPLVWVSPPIDAGFYLYDVPDRRRSEAHRPTAVTGLGGDGEVVTRKAIRTIPYAEALIPTRLPDGRPALLPRHAHPGRAERLLEFRASGGERITLWRVPSARGQPC